MAVITTGNHPEALWPGIAVWWGKVYAEHPAEYPDLVDVRDSDKAYELLVQDVGFELAPVKPQGSPIYYSGDQQGFVTKLVHVTFALGYGVTLEERLNNLYEQVSRKRAAANAFSMRQTKENVVAGLYNRGFNASYPGADGVSLFNASHPRITGGTYSNVPSVIQDLNEDSLEDAAIDIMGFQNDRGMPVLIMPRSLHVSRFQWFNAVRLLRSLQQPGTANNDINAVRATNAIPEGVKVNHFFTSNNAWFLRTNISAEMGGLVLFQRYFQPLDQDNDFHTKNALASSIEMYSAGYGDPRCAYGVNAP